MIEKPSQLDAKLGRFSTAIVRTEREIALMQEDRTAELVTGKLDVRAAAAKLPEVQSDGADASELSDLSEEPEEPSLEEAS